MEDARVIFHQAAKSFFDADNFNVVKAHGGLGDTPDGGVEAGAIAAAGENADAAARLAEGKGLLHGKLQHNVAG
jgi:hypothetical protein